MNTKYLRKSTIVISYLVFFVVWAFRKNRSIWTGAIFHSAWDLITWIL